MSNVNCLLRWFLVVFFSGSFLPAPWYPAPHRPELPTPRLC